MLNKTNPNQTKTTEIINKDKDNIENISRLLTRNFEANKHNLNIIECWKNVIKKII